LRDIFICHAGEDKEGVVRPLVEAFSQTGISCWYDEAEIKWGDSITGKINEGLAMSRYVVVVFSTSFMNKNWPERELNAVLNQEASSGEVKVLPLIVGSEEQQAQILAKYPLLNDKRFLPWDGDIRGIVKALKTRLASTKTSDPNQDSSTAKPPLGLRVPLPKIKKRFSQRDKDLFLRNSFVVVKDYFQNALHELNEHYKEVETDFAEVHNFKFIATIYVQGEIASKCKIWIGGHSSSDSIAYQSGQFNSDSDNSYNDMLSVDDDKESLGFRPSGMWFGGQQYDRDKLLSAERTAEYLWLRFTDSLSQGG
jgi:hypothetical protein